MLFLPQTVMKVQAVRSRTRQPPMGEDGGGGGGGEKKQPRWRGTFLWPEAAPETLASVHIYLLASDGWC